MDLPISEVLVVHDFNRRITGLEIVIRQKGVPFGLTCQVVASQLWMSDQRSESAERFVQQLFVDRWIQIPHKQIGPDIQRFWVRQS